MTHDNLDPHEAFAELGRIKLADYDLDDVLTLVAELAKASLPSATEVSVTLIRDRRARTPAFSGELAQDLDEAQYEHGHGPCLDAAAGATTILVPDMAGETRWPTFTPRAVQRGVRSSLSVGLPVHDGVVGALNIYSATADAFDDDEIEVAATFAGYAAVALANAHLYATTADLVRHMQQAMDGRAVIEQAKGIIMAEHHCSTEEAFAILSRMSQDTNRKLRDLATALVDHTQNPSSP